MGFVADSEGWPSPWTFYPGVVELPAPKPNQMVFNPDCTCGHPEFSHRFQAGSSTDCMECRPPQSCDGFAARQKV